MQQDHMCEMQLTEDSQEGHSCEIISWMHCDVAEQLQNELAVRFHVSLQCVSCELKFFTRLVCGHTCELNPGHMHWRQEAELLPHQPDCVPWQCFRSVIPTLLSIAYSETSFLSDLAQKKSINFFRDLLKFYCHGSCMSIGSLYLEDKSPKWFFLNALNHLNFPGFTNQISICEMSCYHLAKWFPITKTFSLFTNKFFHFKIKFPHSEIKVPILFMVLELQWNS